MSNDGGYKADGVGDLQINSLCTLPNKLSPAIIDFLDLLNKIKNLGA